MFKTIGAVCILLWGSWIGFAIAKKYRERPKQLQQLLIAFKILETEISYHAQPLPIALQNVGKRVAMPIAVLFLETAERLSKSEGRPLSEYWSAAVDEMLQEAALLDADGELLRQFGFTLGSSDRQDQIQHIHGVCEMLRVSEEQAREEQARLEKMWKYLGAVTAVILVILLY
ncbi:stage III sporulation protein AB [Fodinisporobacter ferrooxydans]|uniref:Stage III sporulation protein AB n=1 Tax=Fodinisporobacter ferrooxydans TaxID=2901836 RepID=A0ABY4CQK5_9BACL|nr:stage III sporulation protein AB [Alicyclobacillaceae bacterium MYW30-H2]